MKKLILFLIAVSVIFTGCSKKEEIPEYELVLCDTAIPQMSEYLEEFETESFVVENIDFSGEQLSEYINSLTENISYIKSLSVYSENVSEETAAELIEFVKKANIPVIFAFSDITNETLETYDKAFAITTDYIHAGEITAVRLKQLWNDGTIADSDGNQIFSFSVIKDETAKEDFEAYCSTLVAGIELYGIPMQINSTVAPAEITDVEKLYELKENNEALIIISEEVFPFIAEYSTESENVEIITIQQNTDNSLSDYSFAVNCFVDCKSYKQAADEILKNYNNRQYPLIEISFPVKGRTVFIPATI